MVFIDRDTSIVYILQLTPVFRKCEELSRIEFAEFKTAREERDLKQADFCTHK